MCTVAQIQVVIDSTNLMHMHGMDSNIVHKANIVIQKMFIKSAVTWRTKKDRIQPRDFPRLAGKRHRSDYLQQ